MMQSGGGNSSSNYSNNNININNSNSNNSNSNNIMIDNTISRNNNGSGYGNEYDYHYSIYNNNSSVNKYSSSQYPSYNSNMDSINSSCYSNNYVQERNNNNYYDFNNSGYYDGYGYGLYYYPYYWSYPIMMDNTYQYYGYYNNMVNTYKQYQYSSSNKDERRKYQSYRSKRKNMKVKVDSGCSHTMSGVLDRLVEVTEENPDINIHGFNNSMSKVTKVGINEDGVKEFYVKNMSDDLVLLSAYQYALKYGAIVLTKVGGYIINVNAKDGSCDKLLEYIIRMYDANLIKLKVVNNTYEIDYSEQNNDSDSSSNINIDGNRNNHHNPECESDTNISGEEGMFNQTKYFNTKVNVTNMEELVTAYLISGFTIDDLINSCKYQTITGLHPSLSSRYLYSYAHKWGASVDAFQLALPNKLGNRKGYMTLKPPLTRVGQNIQMDFFYSPFNDYDGMKGRSNSVDNGTIRSGRVLKLPTHGGALVACLAVDSYSGYIHGYLAKTTKKAVDIVRDVIEYVELHQHNVDEFAADAGITSQSQYRLYTPEVERYLISKKIKPIVSEGYNHSNGTPVVEVAIRHVGELVRMAVQYVLRDNTFNHLGFDKVSILKLWGELVYWAIVVINLRTSPNDKTKTRYEVFTGSKPNVQQIRMLPIFAVILVHRDINVGNRFENSHRPFYQYAYYVGPDLHTHGAIRAAYVFYNAHTKKKEVKIMVTTKFTNVNDGGGVHIYPIVQQGVSHMISNKEFPNNNSVDGNIIIENNNDDDNIIIASNEDDDNMIKENHDDDNNNKISVDIDSIDDHTDDTQDEVIEIVDKVDDGDSNKYVEDEGLAEANTEIKHVDKDDHTEEINVVKKKRNSKKKNKKNKKNSSNEIHNGIIVTEEKKNHSKNNRNRKELHREMWPSREERIMNRNLRTDGINSNALYTRIECMFADWSCHDDTSYYYSFSDASYYMISDKDEYGDDIANGHAETAYQAVTKNVPRSYTEALVHPLWGDPARKEWSTLVDSKALVEVSSDIARKAIDDGADVVVLFPVYERKIKDGKEVHKVRLVGNGKTQYNAGATYSPTPSREEFLLLLHIVATLDWEFVHVDEIRAFLNATYKGESKVFARLAKQKQYYEVVGALYGLKTSPRDYHIQVVNRLRELSFEPLHTSSCIFIRRLDDGRIVIVFDFVDDFIVTGSDKECIDDFINSFRKIVNTTEPIYNSDMVLGINIRRNRQLCTIEVDMQHKILELADILSIDDNTRKRYIPMPVDGYIVDVDKLDEVKGRKLDECDKKLYMKIVGSLIWISGIRGDIMFAVMYLTWYTKEPRRHHMVMAHYVSTYLYCTSDLPLVLGGKQPIEVTTYTDSSLATGPNCRSISGQMTKLNTVAGAIHAKSATTKFVRLSSFESELEAATQAIKSLRKFSNILNEMQIGSNHIESNLYSDNLAMVNFIKGDGIAKGVRHMEVRMFFTREQYMLKHFNIYYMAGNQLPADKLTKLSHIDEHWRFVEEILGLSLRTKVAKYNITTESVEGEEEEQNIIEEADK
jgi:hypothetical protein